ncbi:MAG: hypothetical protein IJ168_10290, partial [Eubacterium sp.]|nr:hypothetical protein [Eubacterium sp.]
SAPLFHYALKAILFNIKQDNLLRNTEILFSAIFGVSFRLFFYSPFPTIFEFSLHFLDFI